MLKNFTSESLALNLNSTNEPISNYHGIIKDDNFESGDNITPDLMI